MALTDDLVYMWAIWEGFEAQAAFRHPFVMAGSSPTLKQQLMTEWYDNALPLVLPAMADTWSLDRLYCQDVAPGTAADLDWSGTINATGGSFADPLPGQVAAILTWYSVLQGRSYRGRTYWPGLSTAAVQSGILKPTVSAIFGAYGDYMMTHFGPDATLPYAVLGTITRQHDGVATVPELIPTETYLVRSNFGVQKRRRTSA